MSILIRGMKMPNGCHLCPFANEFDECCINAFLEDQHEITHYCHLIHIPDHGDLIDRNMLIGGFADWYIQESPMYLGDDKVVAETIGEAMKAIEAAPAVIPAERSEDET